MEDAKDGQRIWLENGVECIVATGYARMERLREVFRLDTFQIDWLPFDLEVSLRNHNRPKVWDKVDESIEENFAGHGLSEDVLTNGHEALGE